MNLVCSSRSISQQFEMWPCTCCLQQFCSPLPHAVVQFKDSAGQVWLDICKVSPLKRQVAVQRRIGIFAKNIRDAIRLTKSSTCGFKLRDSVTRTTKSNPTRLQPCSATSHQTSRGYFRRTHGMTCKADSLEARWMRSSWGEVSIKDPTITVLSFCFAQQHGVTTSRPTSSIQLARIEATAIESEEMRLSCLSVCREGGWPPICRATFTCNRSPLSGASSGTCTMVVYLTMRLLATGGTNRS